MKLLKLSLILVILSFLVFNSTNITTGAIVKTPVIEKIDLMVDGSITPITKNLTETFHFITHMTLEMEYNDPNWIGTEFGKGTALTNGTCFLYKGSPFFYKNITENKQLYSFFSSVDRFTDDQDPKNVHVTAYLKFDRTFFIQLPISSLTDLQIMIQDDLTSATYDLVEFELFIQGYTLETVIENTQKSPNLLMEIQDFAVGFMNEPLWWIVLIIPSAVVIMLIRK